MTRGSKIIISLKQDAYEYADEDRIRELVKKYSEFINFPIYLRVSKETSEEVEDDEEPVEKKEDEGEKTDDHDESKTDDLEIKDE